IPFDSLYFDVDSKPDDLQFDVSAYLPDDHNQLASFSPSINLEDQFLSIQPTENENGEFEIELEITNPHSDSTLITAFILEVLSQNDAPDAFSLTSPLNTRLVHGEISFEWEHSIDPEGDDITYEFVATIEGENFIEITRNNSHSFTMDKTFAGKSGYWQVVATDGFDKTYPSNNYGNFLMVADSSELYPFDQVFKQDLTFSIDETVELGTIFGNVFNYFPADLDQLKISITQDSKFQINEEGYLSIIDSLDFESNDEHQLDLIAIYGGYDAISIATEILVMVNDVNEAPTVYNESFRVNENSPIATVVGSVSASDPENDDLVYAIISGNDSGTFRMGGHSGEISIEDPDILDFEVNPTFILSVEVSDGVLTEYATITVNLNDQNEAPTLENKDFTIDENSEVGTTIGIVQATDPENDNLTFSINSGNEMGAFQIDQNSGELTVAGPEILDFEAHSNFSVEIKVSDGELSNLSVVNINLIDINEAPSVESGTFEINENSPVSTLVGTITASDPENDDLAYAIISGNDSGTFKVDEQFGEISIEDPDILDFEVNPTFILTVEVSDRVLTEDATITINLNDENEAPTLEGKVFTLDENSEVGTTVGIVPASDPENDNLTFSINSGNEMGAFQIDQDSGELTVADPEILDFEAHSNFSVEIKASDGELSDVSVVNINLIDKNEAPSVESATFEINENSPIATVVGSVSASDPENDDLIYSIVSGNEFGAFKINAESGDLSVNNSSALGFKVNDNFDLEVEVSDK
ncbi:MAG: cadherin domain-containing protein, partial [Bacteroidota bacterium]